MSLVNEYKNFGVEDWSEEFVLISCNEMEMRTTNVPLQNRYFYLILAMSLFILFPALIQSRSF